MSYQVLKTSKNLEINFEECQKKIRQRSDYGQDICCLYTRPKESANNIELPSMHLCGIESLVRKVYQEVEKVADQYMPILCDTQLTSNQVRSDYVS